MISFSRYKKISNDIMILKKYSIKEDFFLYPNFLKIFKMSNQGVTKCTKQTKRVNQNTESGIFNVNKIFIEISILATYLSYLNFFFK